MNKRSRKDDVVPEIDNGLIVLWYPALRRRALVALPSTFDDAIFLTKSTYKLEDNSLITLATSFKGQKVELNADSWRVVEEGNEVSIVVTVPPPPPVKIKKASLPVVMKGKKREIVPIVKKEVKYNIPPIGNDKKFDTARQTRSKALLTESDLNVSRAQGKLKLNRELLLEPSTRGKELNQRQPTVYDLEGHKMTVEITRRTHFLSVAQQWAHYFGFRNVDAVRFFYEDCQLYHKYSPDTCSYDLKDGDIIAIFYAQSGGKPVIYLFPPQHLPSVNVSLTLCSEWKYSAIYLLTKIDTNEGGESTIEWNVAASKNGNLVNQSNGLKLKYLFWEAETVASSSSSLSLITPSSTSSSSHLREDTTTFHPSRANLNSTNSMVLPFTSFISYLDSTLSSLTLHTAARNDFITYWIPSFAKIHDKGQFIAFRFLPQLAYEKAARLDIIPRPDVVTRIFMLFKGVNVREEGWNESDLNGDTIDWSAVVGVTAEAKIDDNEESIDVELFRVLEWGGMEVLC